MFRFFKFFYFLFSQLLVGFPINCHQLYNYFKINKVINKIYPLGQKLLSVKDNHSENYNIDYKIMKKKLK